MRALVTGANGLLGTHLIRVLRQSGAVVRALVRKSSNVSSLAGFDDVERVYGDVRDATSVRAAAEGIDIIYHTAAVFAYYGYTKADMEDTAREGARNIVDAACDAKVQRIVLTSSSAVLGSSALPESRREDAQLQDPKALDYFRTKLLQEQTAVEQAKLRRVPLFVCNPTAFIGPYDYRPSASLVTVTGYLAAPMPLTYPGGVNLIHAEDVAKGHVLVAERGNPYERYVLGSENWTWAQIHHCISELCGLPFPKFSVGPTLGYAGAALMELAALVTKRPPLATRALAKQAGRYFWANPEKAVKLGFAPRGIRQTLAETIAWLLDSHHLSEKTRAKLSPHPEVLQIREMMRAA